MAYHLIRLGRLFLWLALLAGGTIASMGGAMLVMGVPADPDHGHAAMTACGVVVVVVTFLIDFKARRTELRLEAERGGGRGFPVVVKNKSPAPAQGRRI